MPTELPWCLVSPKRAGFVRFRSHDIHGSPSSAPLGCLRTRNGDTSPFPGPIRALGTHTTNNSATRIIDDVCVRDGKETG
jgi:hypothetical protein